ncbi:hypothetical protein G6M89_09090 [Natronolimnobius sp. AArcel1]|uniref:hypothetical protein n=1 Tax=Natronolimnobius sp. AArcel1 TaxID=1679093 RepID=UPI0013EA8853|nr:hypothetical protein [Natronolimnobius sp. AArcel1]NGM69158.1 hypothetical protein [Natronolimnobius sp. AArcel1]
MDSRGRLIVGLLWIGVAGLMAMSLEFGMPSSFDDAVRLFVVVLALFLAVVYLFNPWGVHDRMMPGTDE